MMLEWVGAVALFALAGLVVLSTLFFVGLAAMIFDAPGSERNPGNWVGAICLVAVPVIGFVAFGRAVYLAWHGDLAMASKTLGTYLGGLLAIGALVGVIAVVIGFVASIRRRR